MMSWIRNNLSIWTQNETSDEEFYKNVNWLIDNNIADAERISIYGASYGGLIGTPDSFVIYVQELINPNSTLISAESKKLLFTENRTIKNKATGMCLSWFTGNLNGNRYLTNAGGGGGYYCEIRIYPELELGSVIMFNRTGMSDERYLDEIDKYIVTQK